MKLEIGENLLVAITIIFFLFVVLFIICMFIETDQENIEIIDQQYTELEGIEWTCYNVQYMEIKDGKTIVITKIDKGLKQYCERS